MLPSGSEAPPPSKSQVRPLQSKVKLATGDRLGADDVVVGGFGLVGLPGVVVVWPPLVVPSPVVVPSLLEVADALLLSLLLSRALESGPAPGSEVADGSVV
jgi:hypothetical protein